MKSHNSSSVVIRQINDYLLPLLNKHVAPSSSPLLRRSPRKFVPISRSSSSSSFLLSTRRKKGRKSSINNTVYTICSKSYLILIGLFILNHVHLAILSNGQFSKESSVVTTTDSKNKDTSLRKRQRKLNKINSNYDNNRNVPPLRYPHDYEKFTIRINTWKREEQLKLSIEHYLTCSGVGQIQVIWCTDQGDVPVWLLDMEQEMYKQYRNTTNQASFRDGGGSSNNNNPSYPRIVIERHIDNTLNERFLEILPIPTAGVLSVDDDVIRPCLAIHSSFVKWTMNPERQVGFDARNHNIEVIDENNTEKWSYTSLTPTEQANKYSITLTRYSFQHKFYLYSYMNEMPSSVRDVVAKNFNCEDIAMSLWISSKTDGKPPLLADYWVIKSYIEIYVTRKISGTTDHQSIRNYCFDTFATLFNLKEKLVASNLRPNDFPRKGKKPHYGFFDYGDAAEDWNKLPVETTIQQETRNIIDRWKNSPDMFANEAKYLKRIASQPIYDHGYLEGTKPWRDRFQDFSTVYLAS